MRIILSDQGYVICDIFVSIYKLYYTKWLEGLKLMINFIKQLSILLLFLFLNYEMRKENRTITVGS